MQPRLVLANSADDTLVCSWALLTYSMIIKKIINLMMPGTEFEVIAYSADAMLLLAVIMALCQQIIAFCNQFE